MALQESEISSIKPTLPMTTEDDGTVDPRVIHVVTVIELIVLLIAVFGNSMLFILMRNKRMKLYSFSVYFIFTAIFDTCTIFWNCLQDAYELTHDTMLEESASKSYTFGCGILEVFDGWFPTTSAWLVVTVCIDRYLSICHQNVAQLFCRKTVALVVCLVLVVCTFIYELPWSLIMPHQHDLDTNNGSVLCSHESHDNVKGMTIAENFIQVLIPIIIVTLLNIRILLALRRIKAFRIETSLTEQGKRQSRIDMYNVSIFYLLVITVLCWLPWMIINMIENVYFDYLQHDNPELWSNLTYAWHVSLVLWLFTFAQNFYVLIMMSPVYRKALKQQCACLPCVQDVHFDRFDINRHELGDEDENGEI